MSISSSQSLSERATLLVERYQLIPPHATIVVGLSGGPDSVFLLHYLLTLRESRPFAIVIAHLNHGWRVTAAHDEQFCRELAEQFGLTAHIDHARSFIGSIRWSGSREEQARIMRRSFFLSVAQQYSAARVALAHHQDDQHETFFIRLMRGAGLQGLRSMTPFSENLYIRPLLCLSKDEMLAYLHDHHIPFVIDETNQEAAYLRNRIRHQVLPALRTCDERFAASFNQTLSNLAEADDFCTELAEQTLVQITVHLEEQAWIDGERFLSLHPFLQKQVLLRWLCRHAVPFVPSQGLFHEITRFIQQPQGGKHILHRSWYLYKRQQRITIRS